MRGVRTTLAVLLSAIATVCALAPGVAQAHLRSGTVAVDYLARLSDPQTAAYSVQVFQSDRGLTLTVHPGHVVVLIGYLGEPVLRLDRAGLWIDAASPTAVAVGVLSQSDAARAPAPRWRLEPGRHSVSWHDARLQGLPPGVRQGPFTVPVRVDGRPGSVRGELVRRPAPPLGLWLALLGAVLVAGAAPPLLVGRRALAPAAVVCALIASLSACVFAVAFALGTYASPGTWIESVDEVVFVAVGCGLLARGPRHLHVAAAIGLGLVGLAAGLLDGAVFFHGVVLATLPAALVRVLVLLAVAAGIDAAVLGSLLYAEGMGGGEPELDEVPGFLPVSR
jgi:hypothetical protein